MTIIKEILDGLEAVKGGIENVRAIVEAVKDGKAYLAKNHPEAREDLGRLIGELRKNLVLIADASAVLTRFRFAATQDATSAQRFNDYFIAQQQKAVQLRQQIEDLRTHCSVVGRHAANISGGFGATAFQKLFEKLNLGARLRREDLAIKLDRLAYEDFESAKTGERMLECLEKALGEVQSALETDGMMDPKNVPAASALLRQYASEFEKLQLPAEATAKRMAELVDELVPS